VLIFYQPNKGTKSPELLQKISATVKDHASFLTTVSMIGGGAIELTRMTKDQMKEVVKPIEDNVERNSVEIKSINQVSNYKFFYDHSQYKYTITNIKCLI
jgi:hypothetical protein